MLNWSFDFFSMSSIPLFFYESSILKKMNMTSVFEKTAAKKAQNCTWYQIIKVPFIKIEPSLDSSVDVSKM